VTTTRVIRPATERPPEVTTTRKCCTCGATYAGKRPLDARLFEAWATVHSEHGDIHDH
jgi:hypothetical protein